MIFFKYLRLVYKEILKNWIWIKKDLNFKVIDCIFNQIKKISKIQKHPKSCGFSFEECSFSHSTHKAPTCPPFRLRSNRRCWSSRRMTLEWMFCKVACFSVHVWASIWVLVLKARCFRPFLTWRKRCRRIFCRNVQPLVVIWKK